MPLAARVLRERRVQCMDGALFAAAALRVRAIARDPRPGGGAGRRPRGGRVPGPRPLGIDRALQLSGLRYREPLYRNLRDLAVSYFESYFNLRREDPAPLLRARGPVAFDGRGWMTAEDDLWDIPDYLANVRHFR